MIPIALLKNSGWSTFITRVEVRNMTADSSKPNKLRNVYTIGSTARNVTIQKRKIYYFKIIVTATIINFRSATERCKSKKGDSVSVMLALFNYSSCGLDEILNNSTIMPIVVTPGDDTIFRSGCDGFL